MNYHVVSDEDLRLGPGPLGPISTHSLVTGVVLLGVMLYLQEGHIPHWDGDAQSCSQDALTAHPKKASIVSLLAFYESSWKPCHKQLVPASRICTLFLEIAWGSLVPQETTEWGQGRAGPWGAWGSIVWQKGANGEGVEFQRSWPVLKVWLPGELSSFTSKLHFLYIGYLWRPPAAEQIIPLLL